MLKNLFRRPSTSWSLAFAHDENGRCLEGRKTDLIDAALSGHSVRFLLSMDDYQYVTDAQCLWVWRDNVYAQNTSHVSMDFFRKSQGELQPVFPNAYAKPNLPADPAAEHLLRFQDASYWWMLIADTQGNLDMNRLSVGADESRGHDQLRCPMKWFVHTG